MIILIVVDRRIRESEVTRLADLAPVSWRHWLSPRTRALLRYAKLLAARIAEVRPDVFLERNSIIEQIESYEHGCVLVGPGGMGKTVLMQEMAARQARRFIDQPKKHKLPVLIPMRYHTGLRLETRLWSEALRPQRGIGVILGKQILAEGRLVLLLDGLDECPEQQEAISDLAEILAKYPETVAYVSTRPGCETEIAGLERFEVPPLTAEESREFVELLERASEA